MAKINMVEVEKLQKALNLTKEEAIELWKCDNGIADNEEQNALDNVAKKVKVDHDTGNKSKGIKKTVVRKVADEKIQLFNYLMGALAENKDFEVATEKENERISVTIGEESFTVNLVLHRHSKA